ncbi:beta and beta-prime subunits of DNA dependent RNA-polymerase [Patellaria atrata CBS 101060]|uniref:DNA-directed RNA polymerase subunit n=1 Tax=Patellaria atrata CBS 101060 TaxID=1346257 RepID=A0A9P4SFY5_9PEZI|nr:beta and beta-prime subunits of DNA dependent RNA-polymerase [Patellaria atrata CBS 101060]
MAPTLREPVKEIVVDSVPKRIDEIHFGVLSIQDIVNQAVVEVSDRNVYDSVSTGPQRTATRHGPLDPRMGISSKTGVCETCGEGLQTCTGHFGYVRLALPAFHIGYFRMIIDALNCICKDCSRVLLPEKERRRFHKRLRNPDLDNLQRTQICKKVLAECKKCKICPYCSAVNGPAKKVPNHPLKIIHDRYAAFNKSTAKSKVAPASKVVFDATFSAARAANPEVEKHVKKAVDDMNPLKVYNIFRKIPDADCELLGLDASVSRPEMFIWQYVPAPPVTIRPSVAQESATTEDDITNKLGDIIQISSIIRAGLEKGQPMQTIMEQWEFMQLQLALYINSDVPGLQQPGFGKSIRGFCQRLKGKQGRFRGNLSGKRVDFSGRTVISPDPTLGIDEVAIPQRVAVNLTYPERVHKRNKEKLEAAVRNGKRHPGANAIIKSAQGNRRINLGAFAKLADKLDQFAGELQIGDVVERHLIDGDIVLFNRQPSLHKLSILSHKAKIRPWRTFRLNECVCNPYNADFDGDEMNLHVPQTEEARAEAIELMGVKHNLATPKNGTPIIAAIQDFITAAYLLSSKDQFYNRKQFTQICSYMFNGDGYFAPGIKECLKIDIPPPAIVFPTRLWTGKQVFNVLMRPSRKVPILVNLDAECRQYKSDPKCPHPDLNEDDAKLVIRNSEVICGVMDKSTVGDGKKDSVFYVLLRDYGPDYAVDAMNRLAKLSAGWLTNQGFSIGVNDVFPGEVLNRKKKSLIEDAYAKCDKLIADFKAGRLHRDPGCDEEQTMENKISGILSGVRQDAGAICFEQLSKHNAPLTMAKCGSKGSNINVSQMVASVGQQMISNARVADGFQDRTLPHFPKAARQPPSKGFVRNSFFSGLTPTEFIFHAMSGREGLVDTAVKTAETGYMSRRLMKSLEDLSANYDDTVRNSSNGIVQFQYGDDKLDPVDMEGKAKPVHFDRTWTNAMETTWDNEEQGLMPHEVFSITYAILREEKKKYQRVGLLGEKLPYKIDFDSEEGDKTAKLLAVDQSESARQFLDTVWEFVKNKAIRLSKAREKVGLQSGFQRDHSEEYEDRVLAYPDRIAKIPRSGLTQFVKHCLRKYEKSIVQPGHAVGAVGAQSIGEPGTQMTLKTFHFAGVAGMSITEGVPRIKEIINASKDISTPVITCELENRISEQAARIVKSRIEKTYLSDITSWIEDQWHEGGACVQLRIDRATIDKLQLDIKMYDIEKAIKRTKGFKELDIHILGDAKIRVYIPDLNENAKRRAPTKKRDEELFVRIANLKRDLPSVVVKGYKDCQRAIIRKADKANADGTEDIALLVEGYGLKECMTTEGVNGYNTRTNSIMEVRDVLGIEAARLTIIAEIGQVMRSMDIDPRHMQLLADTMTYKGDVLGITRFGLAKMRDSVLQLASFEKTPDHLFDAAFKAKRDRIEGVSERIIMGRPMGVGTGAVNVFRPLNVDKKQVGRRFAPFMRLSAFARRERSKEELDALYEPVPEEQTTVVDGEISAEGVAEDNAIQGFEA